MGDISADLVQRLLEVVDPLRNIYSRYLKLPVPFLAQGYNFGLIVIMKMSQFTAGMKFIKRKKNLKKRIDLTDANNNKRFKSHRSN